MLKLTLVALLLTITLTQKPIVI